MCIQLFIHSFIDGHGCYFHISAILHSVYKYLYEYLFLIPWGIYLAVELLGRAVVRYLTFCGTAKLFSLVAAPLYIPTSSVQELVNLFLMRNTI